MTQMISLPSPPFPPTNQPPPFQRQVNKMPHFGTIIGHFIVKKNIYINNNNNPKGSGHYCLLLECWSEKWQKKLHLLQKKSSRHLGALEILFPPQHARRSPLCKKIHLFFCFFTTPPPVATHSHKTYPPTPVISLSRKRWISSSSQEIAKCSCGHFGLSLSLSFVKVWNFKTVQDCPLYREAGHCRKVQNLPWFLLSGTRLSLTVCQKKKGKKKRSLTAILFVCFLKKRICTKFWAGG